MKKVLFIIGGVVLIVSLAANVFFLYMLASTYTETLPAIQLGEGFVMGADNYSIDAPYDKVRDGELLSIDQYIENYTVGPKYIIAKHNLHGRAPRILSYKRDSEKEVAQVRKEPEYRHGWWCDYYWIIDKEDCRIRGPYNLEEFNEMCDSLGVSLQFDQSRERKRWY